MTTYFSKRYTTTANIAAGGTSTEEFINEDDQEGNAPFDSITIVNDDSVALRVNLNKNTDNGITVLANSRESGRDLNFKNFSITNPSGSAHTAGTIHILIENTKFPRRS
jgi:hypothetical protein